MGIKIVTNIKPSRVVRNLPKISQSQHMKHNQQFDKKSLIPILAKINAINRIKNL